VQICTGKLHSVVGVALMRLVLAVFCLACAQQAFAQGGIFEPNRTVSAPGAQPPAAKRRFVPDEVIVTFSTNASPQAIRQVARRYDLVQLESRALPSLGITVSRWRIGGHRSVPSVVGALQNQSIIASAQPNYLFALQGNSGQFAAATKGHARQ